MKQKSILQNDRYKLFTRTSLIAIAALAISCYTKCANAQLLSTSKKKEQIAVGKIVPFIDLGVSFFNPKITADLQILGTIQSSREVSERLSMRDLMQAPIGKVKISVYVNSKSGKKKSQFFGDYYAPVSILKIADSDLGIGVQLSDLQQAFKETKEFISGKKIEFKEITELKIPCGFKDIKLNNDLSFNLSDGSRLMIAHISGFDSNISKSDRTNGALKSDIANFSNSIDAKWEQDSDASSPEEQNYISLKMPNINQDISRDFFFATNGFEIETGNGELFSTNENLDFPHEYRYSTPYQESIKAESKGDITLASSGKFTTRIGLRYNVTDALGIEASVGYYGGNMTLYAKVNSGNQSTEQMQYKYSYQNTQFLCSISYGMRLSTKFEVRPYIGAGAALLNGRYTFANLQNMLATDSDYLKQFMVDHSTAHSSANKVALVYTAGLGFNWYLTDRFFVGLKYAIGNNPCIDYKTIDLKFKVPKELEGSGSYLNGKLTVRQKSSVVNAVLFSIGYSF